MRVFASPAQPGAFGNLTKISCGSFERCDSCIAYQLLNFPGIAVFALPTDVAQKQLVICGHMFSGKILPTQSRVGEVISARLDGFRLATRSLVRPAALH